MNLLIVQLDKGNTIDHITEAHVPSSALKLWFRELGDPLIPKSIYDKAIDVWRVACMNSRPIGAHRSRTRALKTPSLSSACCPSTTAW